MTKLEFLKNKYYQKWYNAQPDKFEKSGGLINIDDWYENNIHFYNISKDHVLIAKEFYEFLQELKTI